MTQEIERTGAEMSNTGLTLTGMQSVDQLRQKMQQMVVMIDLKKQFLKEQLKEGIDRDYAAVPGCGDKKALLKPGAEKLLDWHSYYADFKLVAEKEDWGIGLFAYVYRCEIKQRGTGIVVGTSEGDASTYESKYRFEWKYENQLPAGIDIDTLKKKEFSRKDGSKSYRYQLQIDNLADKRNTVRKMAQKRALVGATVLATATSDLFTTDVDPEDGGSEAGEGGETHGANGNGKAAAAPKDYGNPISEKQGKRLYAIRSNAKVDPDLFKKWLKAKYGLDHDSEIGYKVYEEICAACQSGKLEMPAEKPAEKSEAAPDKPEQSTPAAASGVKLIYQGGLQQHAARIKAIWDAIIASKKEEADFLKFLHTQFPQYVGRGINDIAASDCGSIIASWKGSLV